MGVFIEESEMRFGEYNEANVFNIEKSPQYDLIRPHGVACCEFVLLRSDRSKRILPTSSTVKLSRGKRTREYSERR